MTSTRSLVAESTAANLVAREMPLRNLGANSVKLDVLFSGICHSDIHQVRNEWAEGNFPMVPGHEMAGVVTEIGSGVTKFKVGDRIGVGVFVDSCRECEYCLEDQENFCVKGPVGAYNGTHYDGEPSYGGYARSIVVEERFGVHISDDANMAETAPLLCAGITVYTPLTHWNAGPGKKVAILGMGGLGHLAVKIAVALGAEVTVLGHSASKKADALSFGAIDYLTTDESIGKVKNKFDMILNTTSADLDVDGLLGMLRVDGALVNVGLPGTSQSYNPFSIVNGRKSIAGSNTGGMKATQEMLDFCAKHNIGATVEILDGSDTSAIDAAYDRVVASDIRYRFVIDAQAI
jgi:alcohol dehydrogenase (NADP+)